jgi:putative flippase GtrA
MILTNQKERNRFMRFVVVGGVGFFVDAGTFNLLTLLLDFDSVLASVFSFCAALLSNFIWNRYWTYPDSRSKRIVRQITEFTIVSLSGLLIRTVIFAFSETQFGNIFSRIPGQLPISSEMIAGNAALAVSVGVVMFWNFFVNRYWTYADVE